MLIQKYKARKTGSDVELIGYISEQRKYLGNGCYSDEIEYLISITDKSMPNSTHRGCFIVDKNSIEPIEKSTYLDIFELLNDISDDPETMSDLRSFGYAEKILQLTGKDWPKSK